MARWKLSRIKFGDDQLLLADGEEKTIGRALDNTVSFSSLVISRNHCVLKAANGKLTITDLKSSNGVYIGLKKIPSLVPYDIKDRDIIGIGWTEGVLAGSVEDKEKYMFKAIKIPTLNERIKFEMDSDLEGIKKEIEDFNDQPSTSCHSVPTLTVSNSKENLASNDCHYPKSIPNNINQVKPRISTDSKPSSKESSPIMGTKRNLKRKSDEPANSNKVEGQPELRRSRLRISFVDDDVISISDSDNEVPIENSIKKPAMETVPEKLETPIKEEIKTEKEEVDLEYFNIKQEYLGYDDEAIQIDSDSDSESETWFMRLSQSSPGKPFLKIKRESKLPEENSYSQIEEFDIDLNEEEADEDYEYDMISIPSEPPTENNDLQNELPIQPKENLHDLTKTVCDDQPSTTKLINETETHNMDIDSEDFFDDLIKLTEPNKTVPDIVCPEKMAEIQVPKEVTQSRDEVDAVGKQDSPRQGDTIKPSHLLTSPVTADRNKRAQMIEPLTSPTKKASTSSTVIHSKLKGKSSGKKSRHTSSKRPISNSQKEERKKKLKEIATKEKDSEISKETSSSSNKSVAANVKVTSSNRGAFLTDIVQVVKPMRRSPQKLVKGKEKLDVTKSNEKGDKSESKKSNESAKSGEKSDVIKSKEKTDQTESNKSNVPSATSSKEKTRPAKSSTSSKITSTNDTSSKHKQSSESKSDRHKNKHKQDKKENRRHSIDSDSLKANVENQTVLVDRETNKRKSIDSDSYKIVLDMRIPLKSLKPLSGSEVESISGKPISKVEPFPTKKGKKSVRFSEDPPEVRTFFIEDGNKMKRTSLAKFTPVERPSFSLEKLNLVKILRWNPHWLDEQMKFKDPPPILGTSVPPLSIYHSFDNHHQYCVNISDLLLMEIWECVTQSHIKARGNPEIQMRIEHVPPVPAPDRNFELFSLSVNVSMPNSESKFLPRHGELLNVTFGPDNAKTSRFFFVHNVRFLPSPPKNTNTFCVISLHACYTDKMKDLRKGELMLGVNLGYIQKELLLFEAMENLSGSPLLETILRPEPKHFQRNDINVTSMESNYTEKLNESQLRAVTESVTAALSDRPCINMVQGPPGTGLRSAGGGGGNEELRGEQLVAAERRIIDGADIIVTTLSSAQNHKLRGLKRRIALCIIDEAGQAIEPETLIPLTLDVTKITLVGDPQQLPGYICSQRAKKHGLGESLFYRLTSCIEQWPAGSRNPVILLNRQYRMHPDIVHYPNRAFYNNLIQNAVLHPRPNLNVVPYLILSISSGDKGQGSCGGNEMESWGVARLVASLVSVLNNMSLAVITPYNAHKELIKRNLRMLQNPNEMPVEVNTVDSFQGQERDVVVVSLARSQGVGFLTDSGRMNVMLTRAKHALIVCLNPHAMIKNLQWRTLVEDAQTRNLFRTLPSRLCIGPTGNVGRDEILQYVAFQRPPHP